ATSDALLAQPVGDTVGSLRHLGEGAAGFAAIFLHNHECRAIVVTRDHVEPIQRPVEAIELGPAKFAHGGIVVGTVLQQKVARGTEPFGHGTSVLLDMRGNSVVHRNSPFSVSWRRAYSIAFYGDHYSLSDKDLEWVGFWGRPRPSPSPSLS